MLPLAQKPGYEAGTCRRPIQPKEDIVAIGFYGIVGQGTLGQGETLAGEAPRIDITVANGPDRFDAIAGWRIADQGHQDAHVSRVRFRYEDQTWQAIVTSTSICSRRAVRDWQRSPWRLLLDQNLREAPESICGRSHEGVSVPALRNWCRRLPRSYRGIARQSALDDAVPSGKMRRAGQDFGAGWIRAQAGKCGRKFFIRKVVVELQYHIVRKFGRRAVRVDYERLVARKTIEYGGGCFAPSAGAQLHCQIGGREVVAILRFFDVTGYSNAWRDAAFGDPLQEPPTIVAAVVLTDKDQETCLVLGQGRDEPGLEQSVIEFNGRANQPKLHTTKAFSGSPRRVRAAKRSVASGGNGRNGTRRMKARPVHRTT